MPQHLRLLGRWRAPDRHCYYHGKSISVGTTNASHLPYSLPPSVATTLIITRPRIVSSFFVFREKAPWI